MMNTEISWKRAASRHLRRSRWVGAALTLVPACLVALGCATSGVNRGDVNLLSYNDEWKMGQQLERELATKLKLVNDATTVAYVNQIGQRIVRQTPLADATWEFHVVSDPAINAFNIPGGHVYVNTGLILASDNASELAGVMAHEIAHGVSRHATERLTKTYGLSLGAGLLLGQNPGLIERIATQIAAGGLVAKFSRSDEREADRLGVQYLYAAGYNPLGMATMFEELLRQRQRRPSSVEQFFSTHPLAEDRIQSVRQQARALPRKSGLITHDSGLSRVQQRVRSDQG